MKRLAALLCLLCAPAFAQNNPSFITGQIPTAAQWNSYFTGKADVTGGTINNGVLNSVTINGSLGGSPTVGGVWTASNATLTGFAISGGTLSGTPTFSGTIAGTPTFSGNLIMSGTALTLGSSAGTAYSLKIAAAGGNTRFIQYTTGGTGNAAIRWQVGANSTTESGGNAGSNYIIQPISDTGTTITNAFGNTSALLLTRSTGQATFGGFLTAPAMQAAPGTIVLTGSDFGTAGVSQATNITQTLTGATTSASTFVANDRSVTMNFAANSVGTGVTGTRWQYFVGGSSFSSNAGAIGMLLNLVPNGDMPTVMPANPQFVTFNPKAAMNSSNIASPGGIEAENPVCSIQTTTGYTSGVQGCVEIDYDVRAGSSPVQTNGGLFISNGHQNAQQGQLSDFGLRMGSSIPDTGQHPAGMRNAIQFGVASNPINPYNGAILSFQFQAQPNGDATAEPPLAGVVGLDFSKFAASDSHMRWPGGNLAGGEIDANFLRISQGTTGASIDSAMKCAASSGLTVASGSGYIATEQISDRLGGNLVIDTVNGSGVPTAWHWANSNGVAVQPCIATGQNVTVARAWTIADSATGANVLNIGVNNDVRPGDTVISPTTSFVPGATTVSSITNVKSLTTTAPNSTTTLTFASVSGVTTGGEVEGYCIAPNSTVASQTATTVVLSTSPSCTVITGVSITFRPVAVLSANLTGTIPVNTPITFQLTGVPSNPITLIGGTGKTATFNYTWTTPSTLQIGATVNTIIGTGSALATNATSGFVQLATMAGAPTGTVGAAGKAAVVIDTTNKKICYSTGGGTWECSGAFTP